MTYREKAAQKIAELVNAGEHIPNRHNAFKSPEWAASAWAKEFSAAMDRKAKGTLYQWAAKRQVRFQKEPEPDQRESLAEKDQKFYRQVWRDRQDEFGRIACEECGERLTYAASHVSHNLSRGAHPEPGLRWNTENISILCVMHHTQWEDSHKRKSMKIWPQKLEKITTMLTDSLGGLKQGS